MVEEPSTIGLIQRERRASSASGKATTIAMSTDSTVKVTCCCVAARMSSWRVLTYSPQIQALSRRQSAEARTDTVQDSTAETTTDASARESIEPMPNSIEPMIRLEQVTKTY